MTTLFAAGPHINVAPDTLFHIGPFAVTNAQILGLVGSLLVLAVLFFTAAKVKKQSRNRFAHMVLWAFEGLNDTVEEVIGDKKVARKIAPLAITIVFFFLINNWLGLLPIVGSVTYDHVPLLRGAAADLNTTLGLAIVSMGTAQVWAMRRRGFFNNLGRYFQNPFKDPLHAFEGILEFIAEFSRTAALSLRIFGNVFGGEVLLGVIAFLTGYAAPLALPLFYVLELFVGAVQAYVFFMLTVVFISLGLPSAEDAHGHAESDTAKETA
ncbi:MAG TPA: F0F1 ATP synthase subunit A [Candidatus Saccharimonadales bacterium]|nr:F0F1 ATP synthase subunit A [Candidatus Saccharimonadales bacterium]